MILEGTCGSRSSMISFWCEGFILDAFGGIVCVRESASCQWIKEFFGKENVNTTLLMNNTCLGNNDSSIRSMT